MNQSLTIFRRHLRLIVVVIVAALCHGTTGEADEPDAGGIGRFTSRYCADCHGATSPEADLHIDPSRRALSNPASMAEWVRIHDRLAAREMPPEGAEQPTDRERDAAVESLSRALTEADRARQKAEGRTVLRRLNRVEYENTLRDLLALPMLEVKQLLPPDDEAHGFNNVADAQNLSYVQMARYLEAATLAIDSALCLKEQPPHVAAHVDFQNVGRFRGKKQPSRGETRHVDEWVVFLRQPNSAQAPWRFGLKSPISSGTYTVRVRCRGVLFDSGTLRPPDRHHVATLYTREKRHLHTFDVPADASVVEFDVWLYDKDELEFFCATLDDRTSPGEGEGRPDYVGPGIAVEYLEVEGPHETQWPRESHRRLMGDLPVVPWSSEIGVREPALLADGGPRDPKRTFKSVGNKHRPWIVVSEQPAEDAERLLRGFLERAYRHQVEGSEVERCLDFALGALADGSCFQDAMRLAYTAALCSPDFLYLHEPPGPLDGRALACRLSYFLWRSLPDNELMACGLSGELHEADVLRRQVDRLLDDPRSDRFVADFTGQWLDLGEVHATAPDRYLYPEYFCDNHLVESTVEEAQATFGDMLRHDRPARTIIDSDHAMLNERLAQLYGIEGVTGCRIRRVALPDDSVRGGFLTQAAVLKVTANGLTTSPVIRGAWMLDRFLGEQVPPPPPDAGAIEPDTRGATTIRDLLDKHRRVASCATCHVKIDPPGFALESFDVMGAWRDHYRSFEQGEPVSLRVADRDVRYVRGLEVDASGVSADGTPFDDIQDFRALLLADERRIARNLADRLLTFATGAGVSFADRAVVDDILNDAEPAEYGLRTLVHEVVQSAAFQHK